MRPVKALLLLCLVVPMPAYGQNLLGPLEELVNTLTTPQTERQTVIRPAPVGADRPMPPPVPRPRPPDLPAIPPASSPAPPAPAPETRIEPDAETVVPAEPLAEPLPERIYQAACPAVLKGLVEAEVAPPISEGICGEPSPLLVTGIMSRGRIVPLSSPITTNCQMATALPDWIETIDGYAASMLGSRLAEITTSTSYMCRNRNSDAAGLTSEHGFANAVDVTGFALESGQSIMVQSNWLPPAEPAGRLLRLAHDAACGSFTTVLGPEANAQHADHLHLDLGCHGQACTAYICE